LTVITVLTELKVPMVFPERKDPKVLQETLESLVKLVNLANLVRLEVKE